MKDVELIALAGLLHDIGKFGQRAQLEKFDNLDDFEKGFAVCDKNSCKYLHSAFTAKVLSDLGFDEIVTLASSHHKLLLDGDEKIIQLADWIASEERKEGETSNFLKTKLMSIFSEIALCNRPQEYFFDIQKFDENISCPTKVKEHTQKEQERYKELFKEFKEKIKELEFDFEHNSFQSFLNLKSILEKYTTLIPSSSYRSYPDVSLFDHLLMTAAIASAMRKDRNTFHLIQGDFTSIQSFIFSKGGESNRYLAKILRAKSFFVNMATEYIALKICKKLGITPLSIVMNGGGKFTILAPKSEETSKVLEEIKKEVNEAFAKINYLQTKFVIGYIEEKFQNIGYKRLYEKEQNLHCIEQAKLNASCVMWKLAKEFEREKLKFDSETEVFNEHIEELRGNKELCDICGIVPTDEVINNKVYICKFCKKFKELGEKLPKKRYIKVDLSKNIIDAIDLVDDKNKKSEDIIYFAMDEQENWAIKRVANYIPMIENPNDERYKLIEDRLVEKGKKGDIKSFYHLAVDGLKKREDGYYGRKYLAILKADVDNLGQIFIYGFKRGEGNIPIKKVKNKRVYDEATFSRIVSLSRFMDFYFTTLLKKKIKEKYNNIYTVFSGGDDLFLIGHYEGIIALHRELIVDFKRFTRNKDLHLSFAIRFTSANVPLHHMAEFAEEDLDRAKSEGKNRSVIFGICVKNEEMLPLYALRKKFEEMNYLSDSFLYKLYTFIDMKEKMFENPENSKWRALFNYFLQNSISGRDRKEKEKNMQQALQIAGWIERWGEKLKIPLNLYLYSKRKV